MAKRRSESDPLRARTRLGKYRIERRLAQGGFADVYQAMDTIEGVRVALKMPHQNVVTPSMLDMFQREARMVAKLDHPNILPLKDASFIEGRFVIASKLGEKTLSDRLRKRIAFESALELAIQMVSAVAYAHRMNIIHCDIKPENFILLPDGRLQLADFGIARVAQKTIDGSGSGTVGYMAPEQAMGRPSMKSDVFSLGLIIFRMFTGHLPEWPFDWPFKGSSNLRRKAHPELIAVLRRALELRPTRRYKDADEMLSALTKVRRRTLLFYNRKRATYA
ncbi:MAG: serine/threonine protein kinase [Planctomycetales bacterium]|nr:serine/threonine protein kinase [Planctomycetales bacterium]